MFTAILIVSVLGQSGDRSSVDLKTLNALGARYQENWSKFDKGRIWFKFTDAYAKNADDAAKGVVTNDYKAEGFYAFQGKNALYLQVFSNEAMLATSVKISETPTETQTSTRLSSERALTDGKATLKDHLSGDPGGKVSYGTIIMPGTEEFYQGIDVPLELAFPDKARDDPSRSARLIQDGSTQLSLETIQNDATLDGVKVVRIETKGTGGKRVMWVDPERGAIPIHVHDDMPDGSTYDLHYGDIRMVPGHGWLPYERTTFVAGGRTFRSVVTKVDFGNVPSETFRLEYPEPTSMVDLARNLTYKPQKVWDLSRLPAANSKNAAPLGASVGTPDPVMPEESEPPRFPYTFIALGLAAVVVVVVVGLVWKRRTNMAST